MKRTTLFGLLIMTVCWLQSCTGDDYYYKDLIKDKDIVYPGRISDLSYSSGHNRFALDFMLSKDQQINELLVYWNKGADSLIVKIKDEDIGQPKQVIVSELLEDYYDLEVYTRNIHKVRSIPTKISGRVYGDEYISALNNRVYLVGGISGGRVWVEWIPETREDFLFTEITYTTNDDEEVIIEMPNNTDWTYINNYKRDTKVYFRAAFRPLEETLDIYYSESDWVIAP